MGLTSLKQQIRELFEHWRKNTEGNDAILKSVRYRVFRLLDGYDIFPKGKESVSLKQLEEAIKKRPTHRWMIDHLHKLEVIELAFERIEDSFDAFKKQCVCIPRKQLEELLVIFPSQRYDNIYTRWLKQFRKLLEESK